jgi:hypothetical protein
VTKRRDAVGAQHVDAKDYLQCLMHQILAASPSESGARARVAVAHLSATSLPRSRTLRRACLAASRARTLTALFWPSRDCALSSITFRKSGEAGRGAAAGCGGARAGSAAGGLAADVDASCVAELDAGVARTASSWPARSASAA